MNHLPGDESVKLLPESYKDEAAPIEETFSDKIKDYFSKASAAINLKKLLAPSIIGVGWSNPNCHLGNGRKSHQRSAWVRYSTAHCSWNYSCSICCHAVVWNYYSQMGNPAWFGELRSLVPVHSIGAICTSTGNEYRYYHTIVRGWRKRVLCYFSVDICLSVGFSYLVVDSFPVACIIIKFLVPTLRQHHLSGLDVWGCQV